MCSCEQCCDRPAPSRSYSKRRRRWTFLLTLLPPSLSPPSRSYLTPPPAKRLRQLQVPKKTPELARLGTRVLSLACSGTLTLEIIELHLPPSTSPSPSNVNPRLPQLHHPRITHHIYHTPLNRPTPGLHPDWTMLLSPPSAVRAGLYSSEIAKPTT